MEQILPDSGVRVEFDSGMVRDTAESKIRFDLMFPLVINGIHPLQELIQATFPYERDAFNDIIKFVREDGFNQHLFEILFSSIIKLYPKEEIALEKIAWHYTNGAKKYADRNWEKGKGDEDVLTRYKESAFRHFMYYLLGKDDEDHLSATVFNILGIWHWYN